MSIETPYYKSFPEQWLSGDIYYQKYEIKGAFIDACHHYWAASCQMTYDKLLTRLNSKRLTDELIRIGVIKRIKDNIHITFLDEQRYEFKTKRKKLAANGKKGGLAKARNLLSINKREEKKKEEFTNPALKVSKEIEEMYKNYNDAGSK
jgi:hypothetical protein|tara:strand:+ start:4942 stop:5388 length:447 start_codon:yes stop_codon:yes gene_type:complete